MENKQQICNLLCETLRATRNHSDIVELKYDRVTSDLELVHVVWMGGRKTVNVSMDSGSAMIRDIMKSID